MNDGTEMVDILPKSDEHTASLISAFVHGRQSENTLYVHVQYITMTRYTTCYITPAFRLPYTHDVIVE